MSQTHFIGPAFAVLGDGHGLDRLNHRVEKR